MLILTRKIGERIIIRENIIIEIVSIQQNCVKFGIDAPKEIAVDREEIRFLKEREKRIAEEATRKAEESARLEKERIESEAFQREAKIKADAEAAAKLNYF